MRSDFGLQYLTGGGAPALTRKISHRPGQGAVEGAGGVMPGFEFFSVGADTSRIVVKMLAGIPSPDRHINAAAKCDPIIDNHDFLMMRSGQGMLAIKFQANLFVQLPADN